MLTRLQSTFEQSEKKTEKKSALVVSTNQTKNRNISQALFFQ